MRQGVGRGQRGVVPVLPSNVLEDPRTATALPPASAPTRRALFWPTPTRLGGCRAPHRAGPATAAEHLPSGGLQVFGECEEVLQVPVLHGGGLSRRMHLVPRVLANSIQHPVAPIVPCADGHD